MKEFFRHFFIPHEGNNYHPHILHTKRAALYSLLLLLMKVGLILFVVLLPAEAFILPDVLQEQEDQIVAFTNNLRREKGLPELAAVSPLVKSSDARALDMSTLGYFSHQGPDGHNLSYFLKKSGYKYRVAGENLAMGFSDAQSVINAWIKSPTHYANLIDGDYSQIGIGVEAGYYNGQPTVYVAQHFGDPPAVKAAQATTVSTSAPQAPAKKVKQKQVEGQKIAVVEVSPTTTPTTTPIAASAPIIDTSQSHVYWKEENGATVVEVRVAVTEPVKEVVAYVNFYPVELTQEGMPNLYSGVLTIQEPAEKIFDPVIIPTVVLTLPSGEEVSEAVAWFNPKINEITPVQKYFKAHRILGPVASIFNVTRAIYAIFFVGLVGALIINIVIEYRRQHFHIIFQTVALILFTWILWYF